MKEDENGGTMKSPLKVRRIAKGFSQKEIEQFTSIARLSRIESGQVREPRLTVRQFKQLCLILGWEKIEDIPSRLGPIVPAQEEKNKDRRRLR